MKSVSKSTDIPKVKISGHPIHIKTTVIDPNLSANEILRIWDDRWIGIVEPEGPRPQSNCLMTRIGERELQSRKTMLSPRCERTENWEIIFRSFRRSLFFFLSPAETSAQICQFLLVDTSILHFRQKRSSCSFNSTPIYVRFTLSSTRITYFRKRTKLSY